MFIRDYLKNNIHFTSNLGLKAKRFNRLQSSGKSILALNRGKRKQLPSLPQELNEPLKLKDISWSAERIIEFMFHVRITCLFLPVWLELQKFFPTAKASPREANLEDWSWLSIFCCLWQRSAIGKRKTETILAADFLRSVFMVWVPPTYSVTPSTAL